MERVPVGIPERRAEVNAKERSDVRITGFASLRRASRACQLLADVRWMNAVGPRDGRKLHLRALSSPASPRVSNRVHNSFCFVN
jgi:hypothetical protein